MSNAITELVKLNFEGKEWISELRNKLCELGNISTQDIEDAFLKLNSTNTIPNIEIVDTSLNPNNINKTLFRLSENKNVSGLYDDKCIEFSPNLTIIYGKNGSGKTSYYKILKDAFHSNQNIHGNIYNYSALVTSAKIEFVNKIKHQAYQRKGVNTDFPGNDLETVNWVSGFKSNSHIKFFDSEILNSALLKKDSGWSIDRYKLEYYDKLRNAVENVENKTNDKIRQLEGQINTNLQIIIDGLKSVQTDSIKTSIVSNRLNKVLLKQTLTQISSYTLPANLDELKTNFQQESNLSSLELSNEINLINNKQTFLENSKNYCSENTHIYAATQNIQLKIQRLIFLKNEVDFSKFADLNLIFNPLSNKDKYLEIIKKIAETAVVFGLQNYPENIEKCFYCNQTLQTESKNFIKEIHAIINNQINKEIEEIQLELQKHLIRISRAIDQNINEIALLEICEIFDIHGNSINLIDLQSRVISKLDLLSLKSDVENLTTNSNITSIWNDSELQYYLIETEKALLQSKEQLLRERLSGIELLKLTAYNKLLALEDMEFCLAQRTVIQNTIAILSELETYTISSNAFQGYKTKISRDKGRVENELIRNNYILKFNENLEYFEIAKREKLKRYFSNPGGLSKIESKIESNGSVFEIAAILSEGEAKVFALCDLLTELEFDDSKILVFDDPITSLDQVNIYKVVEKIIQLSANYQVVVITHNFEFYHRLVQQSLGGSPLNSGKCQICNGNTENEQCIGFNRVSSKTHKCGSYYQIEHILQPGEVVEEVMFLTLNWEQRIEILRSDLLRADIRQADKHLRTTINNFFERFVLNDIKRQVYKNNDLIKEWRDMRDISEVDYNALMDVHNKVSGEGTIHEPSEEVRTPLDVRGYITEFNKTVRSINNIRNHGNPSGVKLIEEITI